jgi:hypothetical protein
MWARLFFDVDVGVGVSVDVSVSVGVDVSVDVSVDVGVDVGVDVIDVIDVETQNELIRPIRSRSHIKCGCGQSQRPARPIRIIGSQPQPHKMWLRAKSAACSFFDVDVGVGVSVGVSVSVGVIVDVIVSVGVGVGVSFDRSEMWTRAKSHPSGLLIFAFKTSFSISSCPDGQGLWGHFRQVHSFPISSVKGPSLITATLLVASTNAGPRTSTENL